MVKKPKPIDELCAAAELSLQGDGDASGLASAGANQNRSSEIKVMEVDAFSSVHDMIHAAITSYGSQASLRQVYQACQLRGRIAYRRASGSRLITNNDHWKSQIRHALYTCNRFQRVSEGADLWMISADHQSLKPQTVKVLVRSDSITDSVCDESQKESLIPAEAKPPRRTTRAKAQLQKDPPFLAASPRGKRSSREMASNPISLTPSPSTPAYEEHYDECSHIDHQPGFQRYQPGMWCSTPASRPWTQSPTPSPVTARGGSSAWQRAARHLNSTLPGEQSAEAESPAAYQVLYALRSHSRPPPGFGSNPNPVAELAAREAHARTTGPLKKRLKAAAKAAELAVSSGAEEASSIHQGLSGVLATPIPLHHKQCSLPKGIYMPPAQASPLMPAPMKPFGSREYGFASRERGYPERRPSSGAMTCGNSSMDATTHMTRGASPGFAGCSSVSDYQYQGQGWVTRPRTRGGFVPYPQILDVEEGADETDEGGGKRLLRSHTAAAAADLDRRNSFDRKWSK